LSVAAPATLAERSSSSRNIVSSGASIVPAIAPAASACVSNAPARDEDSERNRKFTSPPGVKPAPL
jgi:hypothetical protein